MTTPIKTSITNRTKMSFIQSNTNKISKRTTMKLELIMNRWWMSSHGINTCRWLICMKWIKFIRWTKPRTQQIQSKWWSRCNFQTAFLWIKASGIIIWVPLETRAMDVKWCILTLISTRWPLQMPTMWCRAKICAVRTQSLGILFPKTTPQL